MVEKKRAAEKRIDDDDLGDYETSEETQVLDAEEEDVNHFIKAKSTQNRWIMLMNCLKEVIFVMLLFIITNSQLYTNESLLMREEIQTRFGIRKPDYLANRSIEYDGMNNFTDFYQWLNGTFLTRLYLDPYYSSLKHNDTNWASHSHQGRLLQEAIATSDLAVNAISGKKTEQWSEESSGKGLEKGSRKRMLEGRMGRRVRQTLERAKAFRGLIESDYAERKSKRNWKYSSWNESEDQAMDGLQKLKNSLNGLESIYNETLLEDEPTENYSIPYYGDKGVYREIKFKSWSHEQTQNTHLHRLLQYSGQQVPIEENSTLFYFPQFLNLTKSPIFFNRLFTTIRIRSRLRKTVERNGKQTLTHEVDTGQSADMKYAYSVEEGRVSLSRRLCVQLERVRKESQPGQR